MKVSDGEIWFAKLKPEAKIPSKKKEDAGYDIFACFDEDYFVIEAGATRGVPTAIASCFTSKYYAQVHERSSTGKIGLKVSAGVMDSGYRGEYLMMAYNTNNKPLVICKKDVEDVPETFEVDGKEYKKSEVLFYSYSKAICQIVMHIVPDLEVKEVSYEELCENVSERGTNCFGSSNKSKR